VAGRYTIRCYSSSVPHPPDPSQEQGSRTGETSLAPVVRCPFCTCDQLLPPGARATASLACEKCHRTFPSAQALLPAEVAATIDCFPLRYARFALSPTDWILLLGAAALAIAAALRATSSQGSVAFVSSYLLALLGAVGLVKLGRSFWRDRLELNFVAGGAFVGIGVLRLVIHVAQQQVAALGIVVVMSLGVFVLIFRAKEFVRRRLDRRNRLLTAAAQLESLLDGESDGGDGGGFD